MSRLWNPGPLQRPGIGSNENNARNKSLSSGIWRLYSGRKSPKWGKSLIFPFSEYTNYFSSLPWGQQNWV